MTSMQLRARLLELTREALEQSRLGRFNLRAGRAFYSTEADAQITELAGFAPAVSQLEILPQFTAIATPPESVRVVLQFVYDLIGQLEVSLFMADAFEASWQSFWSELRKPEWTHLSMCYLEGFSSSANVLDFNNGLTIQDCSYYQFTQNGWSEFQIEQLHKDRRSSTHVLIAQDSMVKSPNNLILASSGKPVSMTFQMLRALRLANEGDLYIGGAPMIGRILTTRPAGSGFSPHQGASIHGSMEQRWPDAAYSLGLSDIPRVRTLYGQIAAFNGLPKKPYNLDLSLRFFDSSYDRIPNQSDARVADLITATEALLGTTTEISFRLSFRTAAILADSDSERVKIFSDMKSFYDTHSRVVHGEPLKPKHYSNLANYATLRDYVRRLLRGFLHLATTASSPQYTSEWFRENLDAELQDEMRRSALRAAMGLETHRNVGEEAASD